MKGSEQIRFCEQCGRNVYNLSSMNSRQVKKIMTLSVDERICAGFNRDKNGAIEIKNDFVSIRNLLNIFLVVLNRVGFVVSIVFGIFGFSFSGCGDNSLSTTKSIRQLGPNDLKPRNPNPHSQISSELLKELGSLGYLEK